MAVTVTDGAGLTFSRTCVTSTERLISPVSSGILSVIEASAAFAPGAVESMALTGSPRVMTTVSSLSAIASSLALMITSARVLPAGMLTKAGSGMG